MRPGYAALVDDACGGQHAGWVPIEHLHPTFSTLRLTDSAEKQHRYRAAQSTVKGVGFNDIRILESGIYKRGEHGQWMCILIYSHMSGKVQKAGQAPGDAVSPPHQGSSTP